MIIDWCSFFWHVRPHCDDGLGRWPTLSCLWVLWIFFVFHCWLFDDITTVFQLYLGGDMMYKIRRRKLKSTLLPTPRTIILSHHVGMICELLAFGNIYELFSKTSSPNLALALRRRFLWISTNRVLEKSCSNGLRHSYMLCQWQGS